MPDVGPAPPRVETWFNETVSGERRGAVAGLTRLALRGAAAGYAAGLVGRETIYRLGVVRPQRVAAKVVSVGNITLGGTGKTPAVIHLAKRYRAAGERVAILIRGHGGDQLAGVNVVHDGFERLLSVAQVGDEAVLLADRLGDVPVLAGKDRRLTAAEAVEAYGATVLVLDDAFQYRRLAIDTQIVLLDATRPFGTGRLFPAGTLRDPPSYLKRADQLWLSRLDHPEAVAPEALTARLATIAPSVPVFRSHHTPARLWQFPSGAELPLSSLAGQKVMGMAGIGNPGAFWATLRGLGVAELVEAPFPDHHFYQQPDIAGAVKLAVERGCGAVVTTEKDAVRLELWPAGGPPLWVLGIELMFSGPEPPLP